MSDFVEYLQLKKSERLKEEINNIKDSFEKHKKKNRLFCDEDEVLCTQISSVIANYFIHDVCAAIKERMSQYDVNKFKTDQYKAREKIVDFSNEGNNISKYMDSLVRKRVINSHEVTLFDQNGSKIVYSLFKAYYENPMLLHTGMLKRIWNECWQRNLATVDFQEGKPEIVKEAWQKITTTPISVNERERSVEQNELLQKRIILVRGICDYISGMTDSYALNEYRRIVF